MRVLAAVAGLLVIPTTTAAPPALFPTPLHLVRRIDDPLAHTTSTVQEYCYGGRITTINGTRVAITDYDAQTLTEIDHARLTYSVTSFADIAKNQFARPAAKETSKQRRLAINDSVRLSRGAIEALIGAAYPNTRTADHDAILREAANTRHISAQSAGSAAPESTYGLPADETVTYENGLTTHNEVVRVDNDLPPAAAVLIDPGATRVESRLTRLRREIEDLDKLPSPRP